MKAFEIYEEFDGNKGRTFTAGNYVAAMRIFDDIDIEADKRIQANKKTEVAKYIDVYELDVYGDEIDLSRATVAEAYA